MKIGNNIESLQSDLRARAVNGSRTPATPASPTIGAVDGVDKVELSEMSQRLTAEAAGGVDADIRPEKVEEVRKAMQEGRFQVNPQVVAEKMISQAAELIESITTNPAR